MNYLRHVRGDVCDRYSAHLSAAVAGAGFVDMGVTALSKQALQLKVFLALPELQACPPSLKSGRALLLRS